MTTTLKLKILTETRERVRADGSTVYVWDGITADGRIVHCTMRGKSSYLSTSDYGNLNQRLTMPKIKTTERKEARRRSAHHKETEPWLSVPSAIGSLGKSPT